MKNLYNHPFSYLLLSLIVLLVSCKRDLDELELATNPTTPEVFLDAFSAGLNYAAFGGSDVRAFQTDTEVKYQGTASMRIAVPDFEDPAGAYAGGVYFTSAPRDLSGYDALTFWAKASKSASIDLIGFGNDLGENKYQAAIAGLPVNTNWKKYYIPLPDAAKLTAERGMLFFSEGPEDGKGYTFWIDEVKFEKLGTIAHGRAAIMNGEAAKVNAETGNTFTVVGFSEFNLPNGVNQRVETAPAYFTFNSDNPSVATVGPTGQVKVMEAGTAVIKATLAGKDADGSLTITSTGEPVLPRTAAPTPDKPADKVISVFSNAYENVPVDFFNGYWQFSTAQTFDVKVEGDDIKRYTQLNFVGIQFTAPTIDASKKSHFHMDIWTPDQINPSTVFKILLVDLGPDGSFEGSDNSSFEVTIPSSMLRSESWISLDLPFSQFPGLTSRAHLAQIVLSGDLPNVFVDNIYFYDDGTGGVVPGPAVAAPNPTPLAANVISIFSDAYTNVAGTDFNPNWGQATVVTQELIAGNNTLKYNGLNYQGMQLGSSQNVSGMEFLHLDFWTKNSSALNVFLISPGPQEKAYALTVPTNGWSSVDIPLSAFGGVDLKDVIQFKFDGNGTIYLDNIYFYKKGSGGGGTTPTVAAPTPTRAAANVISLFSDAYTNVPVDTWRTDWSSAKLEDVTVAGNAVKKYSALDFVGIETVTNKVDATGMTHFHMDVWSPDFTLLGIKLVDFGADGAFGGGDDKEHQINIDAPAKGQWVSLDIPLSDFAGLTTRGHLAQYILVGQPTGANTVYVDNVYFYKTGGGGGATAPTTAAPTPALAPANVISLFSDAYTNVPVDTWRTDWSSATLEDVTIAGSAMKKYSALDFVGIETVANKINATEMTHFHIDVWSADFTFFGIKLVDFGADGAFGGGDDKEHQINIQAPAKGQWVSLDIPLSEFTGLTTRGHMSQYILVGQPTGTNTVFVDNVYFHK
ncbi:MAG: Ig-like domain-containing protein [Lewinellaceae bacterium]|nr:Ig-like domain-containing protein [Lewinellaceae bacterium]